VSLAAAAERAARVGTYENARWAMARRW